MPQSSIEAISQELANLQKSLEVVLKEASAVKTIMDSPARVIQTIDDLENVFLVASEAMPAHVAQKAKNAFKELLEAVKNITSVPDSGALFTAVSRMNTQAELIVKRVSSLLQLSNFDGASSANGMIMAQEEERRRISREIHDGPAQTLASLTMRIDYCLEQRDLPEELKQELLELKESVKRSLKDIRRYIFDLRPMALDDLGLIPTLEQFISGFKGRTGVPVHVDVEGERTMLGAEKELAVFRVIQEAANNAIKHANPNVVHIFLKFDPKKRRLSVVVKDDGAGFDVADKRKNYGSLKKLGLISMEERVRLAGGEFLIVSDTGSGTVVSFWVPL